MVRLSGCACRFEPDPLRPAGRIWKIHYAIAGLVVWNIFYVSIYIYIHIFETTNQIGNCDEWNLKSWGCRLLGDCLLCFLHLRRTYLICLHWRRTYEFHCRNSLVGWEVWYLNIWGYTPLSHHCSKAHTPWHVWLMMVDKHSTVHPCFIPKLTILILFYNIYIYIYDIIYIW